MNKNLIKLSIALIFIAGLLSSSVSTRAYPQYLKQANKFGAKNCLFCHKEAFGGEGWNERGLWLIAEKERRSAEAIDVAWLSEYKVGENKGVEKKETDPASNNVAEKEKQLTGEKEAEKVTEKVTEKEGEKKEGEKEAEKEGNKSDEKIVEKEGKKEGEKVDKEVEKVEKEAEKVVEKAEKTIEKEVEKTNKANNENKVNKENKESKVEKTKEEKKETKEKPVKKEKPD
jgi:hypothetical protein